MPETSDLPYLIKLLDDEDPEVHKAVSEQLASFGGDISQDLTALGIDVPTVGRKRLANLLAGGRRATLRDEWQVPSGGIMAWQDDWDGFEHALRLLSDFLHDGITLRPALSDCLDMMVDEVTADFPVPDADQLRRWLFSRGRFRGARSNADAGEYFDLCHVMDTRRGNPTSLACLFMLLGRRLEIEVEGCNYPGHFLALISCEGRSTLVDCFHLGRTFDARSLLHAHPEISEQARNAVLNPAHLGEVLHRYLSEIRNSLTVLGNAEDVEFFGKLIATLEV